MSNIKETFIDLETGRETHTYYSYEELQEIERQKEEEIRNRPPTIQEKVEVITNDNNEIYEAIIEHDFRLTSIELGL